MEVGRKILIAVDESEASGFAFSWALRNFLKPNDHVHILNAQEYSPTTDIAAVDYGGEYAVPIVVNADDDAEARCLFTAKILVDKYIQISREAKLSSDGAIVKGSARTHICEEAARINANAIIVGTHCYGLLKRTFLGSISDHVIHHSPVPVVVVRSDQAPEGHGAPAERDSLAKTVVIAVDHTKESAFAFTWALGNACTGADRVVILHVQSPYAGGLSLGEMAMEDTYVIAGSGPDEATQLNESEKLVEMYMKYAASETKIRCEGRVVTGPTEARVCEELVTLQADVVVVGTHNISAVAKTFMGSVSDYLAHNSACPVVIAKMPPTPAATSTGKDDKSA